MKSTARLCLGLISISPVLAFVSCGGDDDDTMGVAGQSSEGGADPGTGGTAHAGGPAHMGGEAHGGAGHGDAAVICQVLGELCHEADTGSGPAHDCHELGHVADGEVCEQQFASCIGTCVEDEGAGGAGGGAGTEQDPHCAALGELCHPVDLGSGTAHDCHETGHVGVAADCAAEFDACATFCLAEREKLEAGAGGAGGMAAGGATGSGGAQ